MVMKTPKPFICAFSLLLLLIPAVRAQTYSLGATKLLEAPAAGSDSVVLSVLPTSATWTAKANAAWLNLSAANQSGTGSANVIFTFAANSGATRTGTLSIAGQTLTVTQAGSTYVATTNVTTLVSSGLNQPGGVAVDSAGNIYIGDTFNNAVKEWSVASNTVTTLVSSGLSQPFGVAVDGMGNVYIADLGQNAIKEWMAASNTVTTLVASGLSVPYGVAVDSAGNLYIANTFNNTIEEWSAASNTVTTLVSSGLNRPGGLAVDRAGNVYIADTFNSAIKEWSAASNTVTTLVSSGLSYPYGVAVDGAGNVYIAGNTENVIKEWSAASNTVTTLVSTGVSYPEGVAVDSAGNIYIADSFFDSTFTNAIKELPHAFVDATVKVEAPIAGSDVLPVVLPVTANLTGPFAPISDSDWLTITGSTNGVVSFAFTANTTGKLRSANITLLGQTIPVTQAPVTPPILTGFTILDNGSFQFGFANNQGAAFTVLSATNLLLPLTNWTVLGTPTNNGSGQYQFTDPTATNGGQRFYRVSSP
jgi:DNA-binding beta-propeller fold protein YncE